MGVAATRQVVAALATAAVCVFALALPVRAGEEIVPVDVPPPRDPFDVHGPVDSLTDGDLYLFIVGRGQKLMRCVGPYAESEGRDGIVAKLYTAGRYPALLEAASSVLGSRHPAVQAARVDPRGSATGTLTLMIELSGFGAGNPPGSMRDRLLRSKAVYTPVVEMAQVSDGRCTPPEGLIEALARIQPES